MNIDEIVANKIANNNRGDMFFEFSPIRHKAWHKEYKQEYQLEYRMFVFEGTLSSEEVEDSWQSFATVPNIQILTNNLK